MFLARLRRWPCSLSWHQWGYTWDKRICSRCGRREEPIYNMAYGGTIWREVRGRIVPDSSPDAVYRRGLPHA